MSLESHLEKQIREAIERGDFDNLRGKGKPLDLDSYFAMPEDMRMAFAMLKSNEFVPDEVEKLNLIADLKSEAAACNDETEKAALVKKINELSLSITIMMEQRRRRRNR